MNGGAWERTANYVNYGDSSSNLSTYGGTQSGDLYGTEEERNTSTAYKTVYPADGTSQSNSYNNQAKNIKGDAIYETSNSYSNGTGSWFDAYADFPGTGTPFFARSGYCYYSSAGTFCFVSAGGHASSDNGFRVVLVPQHFDFLEPCPLYLGRDYNKQIRKNTGETLKMQGLNCSVRQFPVNVK